MRVAAEGTLATALSAVLFGWAFPPTRWSMLGWIALAPLLVALRRARTLRGALLLTWLWCLVAAYAVGDWFPRSVSQYFLQPFGVGLALFFAVFTVMAGPYYFGFTAAYRALSGALAAHFTWALPFLAAAAWVAAELGRGRLFTGTPFFIGNPWGLLGYSQLDHTALTQIASVTGVYGVSFAAACTNAAVAEAWLRMRSGELGRWGATALIGVSLLPALAMSLYGALALRGAGSEGAVEGVSVALIQGNVDVGTRWRADLYGENLEVYLRLTREAARGRPALAFWPEAAMTFFLEDEPLYRASIASVLEPDDVQLVAGGPRRTGGDSPTYFNSIFSLSPRGAVEGRYDKEYLVPFAEYFPLQIDVMRRQFGRIRTFAPGEATRPLPTRAGAAGVVVCNEVMLPEVVGERVAAGASYLVNPSNDSWINDPKYTDQQLDMARLRAVEQRRWLVRVSTAGPSALIDPWGRVVVRTRPLAQDVALGSITPRSDLTLYGRVGDAFALSCVAVVAAALLLPTGAGGRYSVRWSRERRSPRGRP
jgi:apolipoprotein N-acyltransferase